MGAQPPPGAPKGASRGASSTKNEPQHTPRASKFTVEAQVSRSSDEPPRTKEGSAAGAQPKDSKSISHHLEQSSSCVASLGLGNTASTEILEGGCWGAPNTVTSVRVQ